MLVSFYRVLKFSVKDLKRNLWLSLATLLVLVLTLISVNGLIALNFLMDSAARLLENKVDVSLYFRPDVSVERAREIRAILNKVTGIVSAKLIEPEEALAQFEERYANDASVTEALKIVEKNPFGPTLVIKAGSPEAYRNVIDTISAEQYKDLISDQTFEDHAVLIEKISKLTSRMNQLGILLSAVFGFIALLIAMTTVRVAIYTHRETIGIMKLVGASNWFVRLPYLIQGVIFSFAAVGLTLAIVYPLSAALEPRLVAVFGGEAVELSKYFHDSFWWIAGGELGAIMLLNVLVTSVAVGRYLRV